MSTPNKYVPGFRLLNELAKKRKYPVGNGVAISIGDFLILTSGYLALGSTLQYTTPVLAGIANADNTAAEAASAGLFNVEVIPPMQQYDFIVPCEDDAILVQSDIGTIRDLQSEDGIDNGDTVTAGLGFYIDAIDVSSAAVASATYGYAIGHFEYTWAS